MGFKISPVLQESMCRLGSKLPFEEASEELSELLNLRINAKQIERLSHKYGDQLAQVDWEVAHQDGVQLKIAENEQVYCMADGSMLLTREEGWKEIKLGRIFSQKQHIEGISKDRGMIHESTYYAHLGKSDDFWLHFEKEIPQSDHLVFICDGAKWLWNNIEEYHPESTQILDFYHCKEHICEFAKDYFKSSQAKRKSFIDNVIEKLMNHQVDSALQTISELECVHKTLLTKKEKLINYLNNNKKRIDYGKFKEAGLLIGSGPIEAANRDVIQKRLKLSGQRWTIEGAQQVANLRAALKSKRWNRVLNLITQQQIAA